MILKQTVQTISFYLLCVFVIDKNIYILTYHVEAQTHIIYLCEQIVAYLIPPSLCYCQTENEYHIFENFDLRTYNIRNKLTVKRCIQDNTDM